MEVWFVFASILLLIGNVLTLILLERFWVEVQKCLRILYAAVSSDGDSTVEVDLDA